ncbi:Wzz/FepE/Etk N-terminal domain-containing protein [Anaeromyxobacter paludicola]|uniref:Polysaccharide chain length determinant N-terminal domain-containing protein n=1 Tax=Anaeromyxobacter paludicola TaxID=2918171 RepID=A0ABM7X8N7_9BACT|nr:Wzz/FepE/Etk N-terminal domain-containing protein [Anaeromyxobacter paludicola]BDG08196.1 hypothetical protein AMPC_13090 [Anaeromyxobacter paludicola]
MERTYTLQELLAALKRRRWLALAVFAGAFAAAAAIILLLPSEYRAESVVQVEPHRLAPEYFPANPATGFDDRMRTLKHGILARPVLERVLRGTDLYPKLAGDMDEAVAQLRKHVEVRLEGEVAAGPPALLFVVEVRGRDREKVAKAAGLLPRYYAEMTFQVLADQSKALHRTLSQQAADMGRQLTAEEAKLLAFKAAHAAELPESAEANMRAAARTESEIEQRLANLADAQRRRLAVLASIPEAESDTGRAQIGAEDVLRRLQTARASYGDENPEVKRLARQYQEARQRGQDEVTRYQKERIQAQLGRIDGEVAEHRAALERLRADQARFQQRLDVAPRWGAELANLSRDYEVLRAKYATTVAKAADAAAAQDLLQADGLASLFRFVQPAVAPERPAGPARLSLLLVALLGSAALGLVTAGAAELLDSSLRGPEDAADFGVPVLAAIPRIGPRKTA